MPQVATAPRYLTSTNQGGGSTPPTHRSTQRHLGRCSDGTLIGAFLWTNPGVSIIDGFPHTGPDRGAFYGMWYSKDSGISWTQMVIPLPEPTGSIIDSNGNPSFQAGPVRNLSFYIDLDDCIHMVWDGFLHVGYYIRGVPNAGRTSWTWSNAIPFSWAVVAPIWPNLVGRNIGWSGLGSPAQAPVNGFIGQGPSPGFVGVNYPDVVAHRNPNGPGWYVHLVTGYSFQESATIGYFVLYVDGSGNISWWEWFFYPPWLSDIGFQWASVEIHHSGDGKTASNPDVFVTWSQGFNFGYSIKVALHTQFAVGSTTVWNPWLITSISSAHGYTANGAAALSAFWDGTRLVLAGTAARTNDLVYDLVDYDVNPYTQIVSAARTLVSNISDGYTYGDQLYGTATYDTSGNLYFVGVNLGDALHSPVYPSLDMYTWQRSTGALTHRQLDDNVAGQNSAAFNTVNFAGVGYAALRKDAFKTTNVEWIYTRQRDPNSPMPAPYTAQNPALRDMYYARVDLAGEQEVMVA